MKMREKPLRGKKYQTTGNGVVRFLERLEGGMANVIAEPNTYAQIPFSSIILSIIDTKDYEKIADEKYKGD